MRVRVEPSGPMGVAVIGRAVQDGTGQPRRAQVHAPEFRAPQVRPRQVDTAQVDVLEVRLVQVPGCQGLHPHGCRLDPGNGNLYVTFTRYYPAGQFPGATGTVHTGGSDVWVYVSTDAGDHWNAIVRDLPAVLSVEVQTLS